jgi:hypothetical protein
VPKKKTRQDFIAWFTELYRRAQHELPLEERRVIQCLLFHAIATWNVSYQVPAARKWLAEQTELTPDQARGALKALINWGWLEKIEDLDQIRYRQLRQYIDRFTNYFPPVIVAFKNPPSPEEHFAREAMLGIGDEEDAEEVS